MSSSVGPNKRTRLSFKSEARRHQEVPESDAGEIQVRLVSADDEERCHGLMQAHYHRGALRKIGETIGYAGEVLQ
jgi:hypothetical protein